MAAVMVLKPFLEVLLFLLEQFASQTLRDLGIKSARKSFPEAQEILSLVKQVKKLLKVKIPMKFQREEVGLKE